MNKNTMSEMRPARLLSWYPNTALDAGALKPPLQHMMIKTFLQYFPLWNHSLNSAPDAGCLVSWYVCIYSVKRCVKIAALRQKH